MLKYQLIANQIENTIYENDLPKGTKLPTVEQLACDYNVSKSTIVKALESLVLKGIVYQVQGSGIFVRRKCILLEKVGKIILLLSGKRAVFGAPALVGLILFRSVWFLIVAFHTRFKRYLFV